MTDEHGVFTLPGLDEGVWSVTVELAPFETLTHAVTLPAVTDQEPWALTLKSVDALLRAQPPAPRQPVTPAATTAGSAAATAPPPRPPNSPSAASAAPASAAPATDATSVEAGDGMVINGSVNNGGASPIAQSPAFGNNRRPGRSLYNGGLAFGYGASALDAAPFSFAGLPTVAPNYQNARINATIGGPLKFSPTLRRDPVFFLSIQQASDHSTTTQPGVMPTSSERVGDFSRSLNTLGQPLVVIDPTTGRPFPGNIIPLAQVSPQALALLQYFPMPTTDATGFNYQTPVLARTRQTLVTTRVTQALGTSDQLIGLVAYQHSTANRGNLFGFTDRNGVSGIDAALNWTHRLSQTKFVRLRYQFTGVTSRTRPFFAGRANVSADAGITGNDQSEANWGPPTLQFSSISTLTDGTSVLTRDHSSGGGTEITWSRGHHNLIFGGDARRRVLFDQSSLNPRGTFTFTGAVTGSDFADFLIGVPSAGAIQFGSSDRDFRSISADAYITDDWRVTPSLTMQVGVRWEVETPPTERLDRLADLDVASGFTAVSSVLAGQVGALTNTTYPEGVIRTDWSGFQPRLSFAWRPIVGSSLVVRGGYGAYRNAGLYQPIAQLLSQQPPVSTASSISNSLATPLTLASGFQSIVTAGSNTFAVDPALRVGVSHNWQLLMQRDVLGFLTLSGSYLGTRGDKLLQEFLPNSYPVGAANPCPGCPSGFVYLTSSGQSMRHAGQAQVRWRLHRGFAASAQYTFSKATDNAGAFATASMSGTAIAQDWLNLKGEQGRSTFDQRHLVVAQMQYLSGIGAGGGLMTGLKGRLLGGWTIAAQLNAGSGLPFTPIYLSPVPGTGVVGALRPALTGASTEATAGHYLNPAAYAIPTSGQWGDTPRNSVTGPRQFGFDLSVARTFELTSRLTFDWRIDATNVLNRETYTGVNTVLGGTQFGLPVQANSPRRLVSTARLRF